MKKINITTLIILIVTALSAVVHLCLWLSVDFSNFFNENISHCFRFALAKLTDILPFSFAEALLLSTPVLIILLIFYINKKGGSAVKRLLTAFKIIICIAALIYVLFVMTFAAGYFCNGLEERLDIDKKDVSPKELYETLTYVTEKVNEYSEKVIYEESGASSIPFDYNELSNELCASYTKVYSKYGLAGSFDSDIKPLIISPVMTYTHISGVYAFFTGEANLNTNYPDYVCAFSAAHELAHQRGIAREDEANFMAYLVCIESDNDYLRYSGYLSMFSYLSSALRNADYELYAKAVTPLNDKVRKELTAYSIFFEKYRDNTASSVSDAVNDTYLKLQGTEGVKSYGMVVDLAVSYHKNDN